MPIMLNCPCGKTLRIADEHAGRRVKCPACAAVISQTPPEPQFEVVDEPPPQQPLSKARAPIDDDDDDKSGYNMEAVAREPDPPKRKPNFRKRANADDDVDDGPRPRRRPSRADAGAAAGKRIAYIFGGAIGLVAGGALAVWAWSGTGRASTKLLIFGVCIAVVGLISIIQGITGTIPEGE